MRKAHVLYFLLAMFLILALPAASSAQIAVGVSVRVGPPALPVYAQPICPGPGYLWTPGYWAYGDAGYYWVPGTWVVAPVGMLWTPGYWGWGGGVYAWHAGYWGPHVGFYGGINYGFGYGGVGFVGGRWDHGVFAYNTAVMHVNTTVIHNTYVDRTVIRNTTVNRVSYNGGEGGINARPTREEMAAEHEHHVGATDEQVRHEHTASTNRAFLASENHGRPAVAATAHAGEFGGHAAVAAHGGATHEFHPPSHNEAMARSDNANGGHSSGGKNNVSARSNNSDFHAPKSNENAATHSNAPSFSHNAKAPAPNAKGAAPNRPERERKPDHQR